jgi:hypothetical protein
VPRKFDISYDEFIERVDKFHRQFGDDWKYGQTFINVLSSVRPDVAEVLRGTHHDPFHKDQVPPTTVQMVKSLW